MPKRRRVNETGLNWHQLAIFGYRSALIPRSVSQESIILVVVQSRVWKNKCADCQSMYYANIDIGDTVTLLLSHTVTARCVTSDGINATSIVLSKKLLLSHIL